MPVSGPIQAAIIKKLETLPPERLAEVADFVDFVAAREADRALRSAVTAVSEPAFSEVWDNEDDAVYDRA